MSEHHLLSGMTSVVQDSELDRAINSTLGEPVIVVSESGNIVRINSVACMLLGYTELEILGQPIEVLVPEELRDKHVTHRDRYMVFPQARQMGAQLGRDLILLTKAGKRIPVTISLSPLIVESGRYISAVIRLKEETRG